ncbi:COG4223 family protein [Sulfitobacter sp.]|uniref:COG4223 family protein n=1 Tax=Sulfitobacter sp. TaxID=1903071 RepID=UPI003003227D
MASSKKTGPSKRKSTSSKPAASKIEDVVIVEENKASAPIKDTSEDASTAEVTPADDAVTSAEADVVDSPVVDTTPSEEIIEETSEEPVEEKPTTTTAEMVHPVPAMAPEPEKGSSFLPLVLGGIIAGGIGFFAAQSDYFTKPVSDPTVELRSDLAAQQDRISALETAPVDTPAVDLSPIEAQLGKIEERITALEERPAVAIPEGVDAQAYAAELQALQSSVETQRSEIEALINNARTVEQATAEAAVTARAQSAIAEIVSAIDAGRPFADEVSELWSLDMGEIDPALVSSAAEGVPTLSALQADFPDQARSALSAARASGAEEGGQQGLGGFLIRSLGARSVAPREGNDPDAVLSRAEAAIKSGDLPATLTELDALPEQAQAAIADWRSAADARVAARMAADALSQRLTAD